MASYDSMKDQLFLEARTYFKWQDKGVADHLLNELYDLCKMGPTSANCQPLRVVFVKSKEAKERLKPHLADGNVEQTMTAPVTAIIAHDMEFYKSLPTLFPFTDAKSWFEGNDDLIKDTAFRNSSLQGGYFIMAARLLGLDCGPMSGFDAEKVNETFLSETSYRVNFLCNLGYGEPNSAHSRAPRFAFDDACSIV